MYGMKIATIYSDATTHESLWQRSTVVKIAKILYE